MNRFLAVSLLIVSAVLAGCATHPSPEMRPYTAEETKQLALEALSRRGLSFDEYQHQRAALTGQPQTTLRQSPPGRPAPPALEPEPWPDALNARRSTK